MKYRVSQIGHTIQALLQERAGQDYWVYGELTGYDRSSGKEGHVYPTLCDYDTQGQVVAKLSLCIFKNDHLRILKQVQNSPHPFKLTDGIEVCFKLRLDFYVPSGRLSGIVSEIDPLHTLEEAKRRRFEILKKLIESGIKDNNKNLLLPAIVTRIGLITAHKSAAEADFLSELKKSGYGFKVLVCHAIMQGKQTEESVLAALDRLYRAQVEVICITRGGGDVTDLQWFDNEKIARAILEHPLPVLSGIGHEFDRCVIDEIAKESFKTPTALAKSLVQRIDSFLYVLHMHTKKMQEVTRAYWQEIRHQLKLAALEIVEKADTAVQQHKQDLGTICSSLKNVWSGAHTNHLVSLRGSLSDLHHSFREKFIGHRYQLAAGQDKLPQAVRAIAADRDKMALNIRGLRMGALKIRKQYDPKAPLPRFRYAGQMRLAALRNRLDLIASKVDDADPVKQLKRGYTITTRANGQPLADGQFVKGEILVTRTHKHTLTSKLTEAADEGNKV
jgi:exodeoxyribonuclease VII large subunit